ncbi:MAG: hypothetical protein AAGH71_03455 [Planctomycetota bacterium]
MRCPVLLVVFVCLLCTDARAQPSCDSADAVRDVVGAILLTHGFDRASSENAVASGPDGLSIDIDRLRRQRPELVVPGEFGLLLGELRLANASSISLELGDVARVQIVDRRHISGQPVRRSYELGVRMKACVWEVTRRDELAALLGVLSGVDEPRTPPGWMPAARVRRLMRHAGAVELVTQDGPAVVLRFDVGPDAAGRRAALRREIEGWLGDAQPDGVFARGMLSVTIQETDRADFVRMTVIEPAVSRGSDQPG